MNARMNNKGMSLLELVISMAISIIVVLMIISFISAAFRVFRRTNDDAKLQMEAQTAMNQMVTIMMEAKGISDKIVVSAQDERYRIDNMDLDDYDYALIYRKDLKKLYLVKIGTTDTAEGVPLNGKEEQFDQENLLTEYVTEFTISSVGSDSSMKNIAMKLELGQDFAEVTKEVNLRNAP